MRVAKATVTFLMVFLIQSTQNRDASAIHLKLDELIPATASDILELARCTCTAAASTIPYRETVGSMGPFQRTTAVLTEALGTVPELRVRFHGVRASSQAHADPRKLVGAIGFEPTTPTVSSADGP